MEHAIDKYLSTERKNDKEKTQAGKRNRQRENKWSSSKPTAHLAENTLGFPLITQPEMEYAALWDVQTQTVNEIKAKDVLMKAEDELEVARGLLERCYRDYVRMDALKNVMAFPPWPLDR